MNVLGLGAFLVSIPFTCNLLSQFPSHWLFPLVWGEFRGRRNAQLLHEQFSFQTGSLEQTKPWKPVLTPNSEHVNMDACVCMCTWMSVCTCVHQCSVQFSCSVVFNSLQPHRLQHTRLPCPSLTPGACSNSCPSSWWCHPTIPSSVIPFSSHLQSFPASGSFPMSQFFASGGQSIGVSANVYFRVFASMLINKIFLHCPYQDL